MHLRILHDDVNSPSPLNIRKRADVEKTSLVYTNNKIGSGVGVELYILVKHLDGIGNGRIKN